MKRYQKKTFGRRHFLEGLGAAAALSPFIPLLNAHGADTAVPVRLILFTVSDGTVPNQWMPTGTETSFTLGSILSPLNGALPSGRLLRDMVVFMDNVRLNTGSQVSSQEGHAVGMAGLWTASSSGPVLEGDNAGWATGPSIDQVVAQALGSNPLTLGVQPGTRERPITRSIYSAANQPVSPASNPYTVFTNRFESILQDAASFERLRARRQSVLDFVREDIGSLRQRLGGEDKNKLDAHLAGIESIESTMQTPTTACAPVSPNAGIALDAKASHPAIGEAMMDLIVQAFNCDLTRVASIQWSDGFGADIQSWLNIGINNVRHFYSHQPKENEHEYRPDFIAAIDTWNVQQFANLMRKLDAIPEGSGTMLDNTLLVFGKPLSNITHSQQRAPFLLAGGAGGTIRPGRFLNYTSEQPHDKLLVAIMNAIGVSGVSQFGNRSTSTGPLAGVLT